MPFEAWGTSDKLYLTGPGRPFGYGLLLVYGLMFAYLLYRQRQDFRHWSSPEWSWAVALWAAAILCSQLFPISLSFDWQLAPLSAAQNPVTRVTLLTAVPLLLAGVVLNPGAALIAGFASGLATSLAESHQLFDPFHFALAAWLAATWLQQNYSDRIYRWLRHPVVSGGLAFSLIALLVAPATYAAVSTSSSRLAALDLALSTTNSHVGLLFIEGAFGGLLVWLILLGVPQLRPSHALRPSPERSSLSRHLLNTFIRFAIILAVLMVTVVFGVSTAVATRLVTNQMRHDAQAVSAEIPDFQARLQNLLTQYSQDQTLLSDNPAEKEKSLRQMFRANPLYRRILLVNADETITAAFPEADTPLHLTDLEQAAMRAVLASSAPNITSAQDRGDEHVLSFVVPVMDADQRPAAVLIGRVPGLSLDNLIIGLQGTVGEGSGYIVDEQSRIIAHPDSNSLLNYWYSPITAAPLGSSNAKSGVTFQGRRGDTNARELVYYVSGDNHPWTVVLTVPYEVVLRLALNIAEPLLVVLVVVMGAFYINLALVGRNITRPLQELVQAAKAIASGRTWNVPPETAVTREDEVGQLSQAFAQMQRALKNRLEELSLLLSVSHDVSASIDINQGMPAILRGGLRGTGATGACAIVFNPSGGNPLTFGEGPSATAMQTLNRVLATRLRDVPELVLSNPAQIRAELNLAEDFPLPVPALIAFALRWRDRFQGVVWMGYRQPHRFSQAERNLLSTLASQSSILVENARLYATADSGWRRLAAVLASTQNAVIVTDQTNRVLLVNRATERIFQLNASEVMGRAVTDVITQVRLVEALTRTDQTVQNQELEVDGRTYFINTAPVVSNEGQALGHVAVLQDITHYKEMDSLKSDLMKTVSHELRNPLTVIRGYVTMLPSSGEINARQQEFIDRTIQNIDGMSQMVTDFLDLKRIEAGQDIRFTQIDVPRFIDHLAEDFKIYLLSIGIKLQVEVIPDIPPIYADPDLLRRALSNYLTNGAKYAPQGRQITLRAEQMNGEVIFSVKDQGPGIPPESQMRLFEMFYRVKQRGTEKVKGSGIGLALVKSVAEKHGGRAWCHSEVGQGSTFFLAVPIVE